MESTEKVLRNFFSPEGRLKAIPVKRTKRDVIMDHLAAQFDSERQYSEAEVNALLLRYHEDFCTIRRELVDTGRLRRANGLYWKKSGPPCDSSTVVRK